MACCSGRREEALECGGWAIPGNMWLGIDHEAYTNWLVHGRALWINGIGECDPGEQSIAGEERV